MKWKLSPASTFRFLSQLLSGLYIAISFILLDRHVPLSLWPAYILWWKLARHSCKVEGFKLENGQLKCNLWINKFLFIIFSLIVFGGLRTLFVLILLCHPSEDSLQWSTIPAHLGLAVHCRLGKLPDLNQGLQVNSLVSIPMSHHYSLNIYNLKWLLLDIST